MTTASLTADGLPVLQRLALVYAPAHARQAWLAFFALDTRLASFVRGASEPLTAQLRLAWWREALAKPADDWPHGEPLLSALQSWQGQHCTLQILVDGWEAMALAEPGHGFPAAPLADARAQSIAALARVLNCETQSEDARRMALCWAMADIAAKLSDPVHRSSVMTEAEALDWNLSPLSRDLRPLAVLHALARRARRKGITLGSLDKMATLTAVRAGFFGR